ncbi:Uncharacterized protein Adt_29078 [Abeliophyllum distichum]|uniref:Uncharacterized protein n=1 Tax=Abeliophyllum distichum TaxID=126358 RepID=A0ABD1RYD2_9LAMI
MLLHDSRNDDGIKSFFQEVHKLYIKTLLNTLYLPGIFCQGLIKVCFQDRVFHYPRGELPMDANHLDPKERCSRSEDLRNPTLTSFCGAYLVCSNSTVSFVVSIEVNLVFE